MPTLLSHTHTYKHTESAHSSVSTRTSKPSRLRQVDFLKSHLISKYTVKNDSKANFRESLPEEAPCHVWNAFEEDNCSQNSVCYQIYYVKWLSSWFLRDFSRGGNLTNVRLQKKEILETLLALEIDFFRNFDGDGNMQYAVAFERARHSQNPAA